MTVAPSTDRVSGESEAFSPVPTSRIVGMLVARTLLFLAFQAVIAGLLLAIGSTAAWTDAGAWWPIAVTAANLVMLALLVRVTRLEDRSLRTIYAPDRSTLKGDLLFTLLLVVLALPAAMIPNIGLATVLFGDPQIAFDMFVQPLPLWAALIALVAFPLTIALTELPTYFGYVQRRLAEAGHRAWVVIVVPALFLALQHVAMPLLFDWRFALWRALMFLPFALLLGWGVRRRPGVLPYLLIVHFLLDLQVGVMVLMASVG